MAIDPAWLIGSGTVAVGLLLLLRREPPQRRERLVSIACALSPLAMVFVLNPDFRIYSRHGLLHASILLRITEEGIPPSNPFAAGEPLGFHWAYEWVASLVSMAFGTASSWSFAVVSLAALAVLLVVLARVSGPLFDDPARGLLAPLTAVFAITPIPLWWFRTAEPFQQHLGPLMARATPVFQKFANTNGVPLGLACLALAVFSVRAPRTRPLIRDGAMATSVTATGLLYPPLLPAVVLTVAVFSVVENAPLIRRQFRLAIRQTTQDAASVIAGCILAMLGMAAFGFFPNTSASVFDKPYPAADIAAAALTLLPIILVILIVRKRLLQNGDRLLIRQLLIAAAANTAVFLTLSLTDRNEYKFLIVGQLLLGLVGGAALLAVRESFGRVAAGATTLLFLGSFVHIYADGLHHHRNAEVHLTEDSGRLIHPDPGQNRLYTWIGTHTPPKAAFVDRELLVTVLGPRAVIAPYRSSRGDRMERERGYLNRMEIFAEHFQRLDPEVASNRRRLVQTLLDGGGNELGRLRALLTKVSVSPVFVVCRTAEQHHRLIDLGSNEVFHDRETGVVVMRWTDPVQRPSNSPLPLP